MTINNFNNINSINKVSFLIFFLLMLRPYLFYSEMLFNFIIDLVLVCFLMPSVRIIKDDLYYLSILFILLLFYLFYSLVISSDLYFLTSINHYFQLIFFILIFSNFLNNNYNFFDFVRKNYIFFIIIFIIFNVFSISYSRYDSDFNRTEFTLLQLILLFTTFTDDSRRGNIYFIIFVILSIFISERITYLFSFFLFSFFKFYKNSNKNNMIRFLLFTLFIYPIVAINLPENIKLFLLKLDFNSFMRIEYLQLSWERLSDNFLNLIVGSGFNEPYRNIYSPYTDNSNITSLAKTYNVSNHNSIYDFFYRFGLIIFILSIYFQKNIIFNKTITNSYFSHVYFFYFFLIFQLSFNPWMENQNEILLVSFLISLIIFYHRKLKIS